MLLRELSMQALLLKQMKKSPVSALADSMRPRSHGYAPQTPISLASTLVFSYLYVHGARPRLFSQTFSIFNQFHSF